VETDTVAKNTPTNAVESRVTIDDAVRVTASAVKFGATSITRGKVLPPNSFGRNGDLFILDNTAGSSEALQSDAAPTVVGFYQKKATPIPSGPVTHRSANGGLFALAGDRISINGMPVIFTGGDLTSIANNVNTQLLGVITATVIPSSIRGTPLGVGIPGTSLQVDTGLNTYTVNFTGFQSQNQSVIDLDRDLGPEIIVNIVNDEIVLTVLGGTPITVTDLVGTPSTDIGFAFNVINGGAIVFTETSGANGLIFTFPIGPSGIALRAAVSDELSSPLVPGGVWASFGSSGPITSSPDGLLAVLDDGVDTTGITPVTTLNFIGTTLGGNPVGITLTPGALLGQVDITIGDGPSYASNWNANNGTSGNQTITDSALAIVQTFISSPTSPGVPFENTLSNAVNRASRTSPWTFTTPGTVTGLGPGSTMLVEVINGAGAPIYSGTASLAAAGAIPAGANATVTVGVLVIDGGGPESAGTVSVSINMAAILPGGGPARVRLTHTVNPASSNLTSLGGSPWVYQQPAGPTGLVFFDNGPTPPTLTGAPTIAQVTPVTKFLSGVEYYTTGSTFNLQHTGVGQLNNLTSATIANGGAIRIVGTEYGLTSQVRSVGGPGSTPLQFTGWNNTFNTTPVQFNEATWPITAANYRYVGLTANVEMRVADVWNVSAAAVTADAGVAIDTFGITSTNTSEFFDDEARRQNSGFNGGSTAGNWISNADLLPGEALVYGGQLMVPNQAAYIRSDGPNSPFLGAFTGLAPNPLTQPNYTLLGAPANYYRSFPYTLGGSIASAIMNITGTFASGTLLGDLVSGDLQVFIRKVGAATGNFGPVSPPIWLHGAASYNFATFDDGNTQTNAGAGARTTVTGTAASFTFGGFSMQLGIFVHVRINNPVIRISGIALTF
jgi:hypothetical protein